MSLNKSQDSWWQSFYEDSPFELYMERTNQAEMEASIAFLKDKLELHEGATIFDQCCGLGGMSIPLARLGYRLIGVDLCHKYIESATAQARALRLEASFSVGDAFQYRPLKRCDAAFNWYTSFGYAREDEQNKLMIARAFESLKPGRWFVLDFLNMPIILTAFKTDILAKLQSPEGEILQKRACSLDLHRGTMNQHWTWIMPDGRTLEKNSTLRAYMPCDLVAMFEDVGFQSVQLFGGVDGQHLSTDSGRCIVLGRRPL